MQMVKEKSKHTDTITHLSCHDNTGSTRIYGDITSHQAHILELLVHLTVLLVAESLGKWAGEWRRHKYCR